MIGISKPVTTRDLEAAVLKSDHHYRSLRKYKEDNSKLETLISEQQTTIREKEYRIKLLEHISKPAPVNVNDFTAKAPSVSSSGSSISSFSEKASSSSKLLLFSEKLENLKTINNNNSKNRNSSTTNSSSTHSTSKLVLLKSGLSTPQSSSSNQLAVTSSSLTSIPTNRKHPKTTFHSPASSPSKAKQPSTHSSSSSPSPGAKGPGLLFRH